MAWHRVAIRYDRCPGAFLSVITLAAIVLFWLCVLNLGAAHSICATTIIHAKAA